MSRVGRVARVLGILVFLAGVVSAASAVLPQRAGMAQLLGDVRSGRTSSIHLVDVSLGEGRARWGDGFLESKTCMFRLDALPGEADEDAFERMLRERLGNEAPEDLTFDGKDPLAPLGGLSTLVPLLYWRVIEAAWLKWASLAVFAASVTAMLTREMKRTPSAGYWLISAFIGPGTPAYLWTEPDSLRRTDGSEGRGSGISGRGVVLRSACWSGVVLLTVWSALSLR
ncbi:hypothetical protein AB0467_16865 [Streptomyces sp. NPDC052095]|uniref:hypothetical protein n=1 Tax=unclassified Streptomyces TaxID=2593676 RepID=UPI00344CD589